MEKTNVPTHRSFPSYSKNVLLILVLGLLAALVVAGCQTEPTPAPTEAPTAVPQPTPNIQATIDAAVAAAINVQAPPGRGRCRRRGYGGTHRRTD